jgi:hypothetical protein
MWYSAGYPVATDIGYATSEIFAFTKDMFIPITRWLAGDTVHVPVMMSNPINIAGIDYTVAYDTALLEYINVDTTAFTAGFLQAVNATVPGTLAVSMADANPVSTEGEVAVSIIDFLISPEGVFGDTGYVKLLEAGISDSTGTSYAVSSSDGR